jgi:hypothetical protein
MDSIAGRVLIHATAPAITTSAATPASAATATTPPIENATALLGRLDDHRRVHERRRRRRHVHAGADADRDGASFFLPEELDEPGTAEERDAYDLARVGRAFEHDAQALELRGIGVVRVGDCHDDRTSGRPRAIDHETDRRARGLVDGSIFFQSFLTTVSGSRLRPLTRTDRKACSSGSMRRKSASDTRAFSAVTRMKPGLSWMAARSLAAARSSVVRGRPSGSSGHAGRVPMSASSLTPT